MALDLTVIDSFTDKAFAGNPAAVAVVEAFPDLAYMQAVAREMNLSETAFVAPREDGSHDLRWFTPSVEVDLCGHATLAAAFVLGGSGVFHTRSGVLTCSPAANGWIEMDFPADPPTERARPEGFAFGDALWFGAGTAKTLVEIPSAAAVRGYVPDFGALEALGGAVIVTAAGGGDGIDFVSRFFAPTYGIPEDPVTGSAHCVLGPYWADKLGRTTLVGEQASARGGIVRIECRGDRVTIAGQAVTVSRVQLLA
jgi:predicted PhzF superfamily epimerase YddE/YHI9